MKKCLCLILTIYFTLSIFGIHGVEAHHIVDATTNSGSMPSMTPHAYLYWASADEI